MKKGDLVNVSWKNGGVNLDGRDHLVILLETPKLNKTPKNNSVINASYRIKNFCKCYNLLPKHKWEKSSFFVNPIFMKKI